MKMRGEPYNLLRKELKEVGGGVTRYIDLWDHNVEFIEQEESWECPVVFVEFCPIRWNAMVNGAEYRAEPEVKLHIVADRKGVVSEGSPFMEKALEVFDLPELTHERLACVEGDIFVESDLMESQTNYNHEEIVENIEVYRCVALKWLQQTITLEAKSLRRTNYRRKLFIRTVGKETPLDGLFPVKHHVGV